MDLQVIFIIPHTSIETPERLKAMALALIPTPAPPSLKITALGDASAGPHVKVEYTLTGLTPDAAAAAAVKILNMEKPA